MRRVVENMATVAPMRRVRVMVVLLLASAGIVPIGATRAHADPLGGVVFTPPFRTADGPLPVGTTPISGGLVPPGVTAQQQLLHIVVVPNPGPPSGSITLHACNTPSDPATDIILPIDGRGIVSNDVWAPMDACLTSDVDVARFIVEALGYATGPSGGGSAYVDLPFAHVATIVGPVANAPIGLSALGVPSDASGVAVWLDAVSPDAGFAILHPCDQASTVHSNLSWSPDQPATTVVAGTPTSTAGLCIDIRGRASVDVSIDGYYGVGVTPSPTSPPQVRYSPVRAPGFVGTSPTRLFDTRTTGIPILGGQAYRLDLGRYVPAEATAVVMNVTVTEPTASGFITVYPCDGARPLASSLNYRAGQTVPNLVTVAAGSTLEVCFYAMATTHLLADLAGYYVFGGGDGFSPSAPVRLFDTRKAANIPAGSVFDFDLSPYVDPDASAVVFNLTATEVQGPGFITAFPCGQARPLASNLNVSAGQTVPNLVTVALPSNKHVCFFTVSATDLLADLAGWYSPSATSGFIPIDPMRWIDTRDVSVSPLPAGNIETIPFGNDFPEPTALVFNATVTEPTLAGYLTAYPCGAGLPEASNVNFIAGQTVPNMVISALDSSRELCLFNSAPAQWIVDVSGFFTDTPLLVEYFPVGTDVT